MLSLETGGLKSGIRSMADGGRIGTDQVQVESGDPETAYHRSILLSPHPNVSGG